MLRTRPLAVWIQLALVSLVLLDPLRSDEKEKPEARIEAGKPAPDFTLKAEDGKDVQLSSFRGKQNVLVAFYPKDFTGGCTAELKGFRDEHETFVKAGVQVLGISVDGLESHRKFCAELKLPFPLLSDAGGAVSKQFDILSASPAGGFVAGRAVFLIDKQGIVRYADSKYDLKSSNDHDALLEAVASLGSKAKAGPAAPAKIVLPKLEGLVFGSIKVDGKERTNDVVIDRGKVRDRDKDPSRGEREKYNHTPLTPKEDIPWDCKTLLIGTGMSGQLPVTDELKEEARKRGVKLILKTTPDAVQYLKDHFEEGLNAVLHITC